MTKAFICPCEDVTVKEVEEAIDRGHTDVESLKRYTGFGTGLCQGKQCLGAVLHILAAKCPGAALVPFTPRPTVYPTALSHWASACHATQWTPLAGVPIPSAQDESLSRDSMLPTPLPKRAHIVIIGAGIMGLALAWHLTQHGETDIVVLDKGYLCAGASGRNGGGVRAQWSAPTFIELAKRSMVLMRRFARDMGINVWFRRGGYLFLATSNAAATRLERAARLHNRHGVPTEILTPSAAQERVPQLHLEAVKAAAWNAKDAVVFPWPFLWGYAQKAAQRGVRIETFTQVQDIQTSGGRVACVVTQRGPIACDTVVLAAGAWSASLARLAQVQLPNQPRRHEICSTEPLKPFLGPLVSVLDEGLYFSQSMRGEIVGGIGDALECTGTEATSTARFLTRYAQALTRYMPALGEVKVLRQWAGAYDVTPDNFPILGRTPQLPNLLHMSGFVGHGFMMAPAVAQRMAAWMATGASDELFQRFGLERFAKGQLEKEDMIIG